MEWEWIGEGRQWRQALVLLLAETEGQRGREEGKKKNERKEKGNDGKKKISFIDSIGLVFWYQSSEK